MSESRPRPERRPERTDAARHQLLIASALLVGMGALDAGSSVLRYRLSGEFDPGWRYVAFETVPWVAWLPIVPIAWWLVRRLRPGRLGVAGCVLIHASIGGAAAIAHAVLASGGRLLCGPAPEYATFAAQFERVFPELVPLNIAVYAAVVAAFYAVDARAEGPGGDPFASPATDAEAGSLTRIAVRDGDRIRFVPAERVDWLEADGNYVRLHAGDEVHRIRATLSGTLARLDPDQFVRIHRSRVVNLRRVREVQPWFGSTYLAILDNGDRLGVSRGFRKDLLSG